jgi:4-hydroxybenzoate polyprenyltransferase
LDRQAQVPDRRGPTAQAARSPTRTQALPSSRREPGASDPSFLSHHGTGGQSRLSFIIIRGYVQLLRPANVATALADVLAGYALAGLNNPRALPWLLIATACLYGGGVVLNDFFDRDVDRVERPERPIPSGRVSASGAAAVGTVLLAAGAICASMATRAGALIALAIAAAVVFYDVLGKRSAVVAPVNMGLCRALNLLLGVAAVPAALDYQWPVALIPLAYIAGVTALSRGEVHGGRRRTAAFALVFLSAGLAGLAAVVFRSEYPVVAGALFLLLVWRVFPPFVEAGRVPEPGRIRRAVKRGVLSLMLVNAVIGTAYAGPAYGAIIVATALAAGWLARMFPVT